jgi:hypothetical protein
MSRKALVPVQLPADPVTAFEAATKQYVDGFPPVTASAWEIFDFNGSSPSTGRPGQILFDDRQNQTMEWRPQGLQWGTTGAHLRCDLLAAIPSTDYEVVMNVAPQYADAGLSTIAVQLGPTNQSTTEGGFFQVRDVDGMVRCGGALFSTVPPNTRWIRFGRWNGLCHVQSTGGETTSATSASSWNGLGPIYIGAFPTLSSMGTNSVVYSFEVKRKSTGVLLASFYPSHIPGGALEASETWTDPQGNTWTQVGTPLQTVLGARWVNGQANTSIRSYTTAAALASGLKWATDPPYNGTVVWLGPVNGLGIDGGLLVYSGGSWMPIGIPIFSTVAQRDTHWTAANFGSIKDGSMCITIDTDTLWQYTNGLWVGMPKGYIAGSVSAGAVSCPINTITYLTSVISVPFLTGRRYKISWCFRAAGRTDASATVHATNLLLYDGTTAWSGSNVDHWYYFANNWTTITGFTFVTGDGVTRSIRLGVGGAASPATALTIYPTSILVEDIGVG